MIRGEFDPTFRRPYVQGRLILPRLKADAYVDFLVDTGADCTVVFPTDAVRLGIDYAKLRNPIGTIGTAGKTKMYAERAVLLFAGGETLVRTYRIRVAIPLKNNDIISQPSLLGQDVLRNWNMRHDPPSDHLEFRVRRADRTYRATLESVVEDHFS